MEHMDQRIGTYVGLFFENIPYSEKNAEMKNKVINQLNQELESSHDFESLAEKYNTLEKLCLAAGYEGVDINGLKNEDNLVSPELLKKKYAKKRKAAYITGIFFAMSLAFFFNFFVYFHYIYVLFACVSGLLFLSRILKYKKTGTEKETYSLEAYQYLKRLHDKNVKKFYNTFFLFLAFTVFYIVNIFIFSVNSKQSELLEIVNSLMTSYEVVLILLTKNYLLLDWTDGCIGFGSKEQFRRHFRKAALISAAFWMVYIAACIFFQGQVINTFLLFLAAYGIGILIHNFVFRKKITYQNIVINKKRIAFYCVLLLVSYTYSFLQKDFWVLQPVINSMPDIGNHSSTITYDDESGIYTIVDNDGGTFKILQLTDIHLGGSIFSYAKDCKALDTVYQLLEYTRPDFVIVTGDLTFPLGLFSFSINNHTPVMEFASFMRNLGIPWAFTYGNHDTEAVATYSEEDLDQLYQVLSYKTSKNLLYPYTQPGITGRSNQLIELRNADGSLNQALFLIDSNAYTGEGFNKYDYIHDDQVEWYRAQILRLEEEEQKSISSMLFFHIPLQQYKTAYQLYESGSPEVTYFFGSNDEKLFDKVCASEYPSRIFDVAVELNSTKAMFCGHDHYNNMSLEYQGIRLTYGMSIDYLAMPGISNDVKQRGATLITVYEDASYDIEQIPYTKLQGK